MTDSKLLSAERREELFEKITACHAYGVGFATSQEVDVINVLQASFLAMKRALMQLGRSRGHVLVDGHLKIPDLPVFKQTALVKGDLRCKPISAASIIAKVTRDRYMRALAKEFPDYGFEEHKGYGTAYHRDQILELGVCREHRRTFAGVASEIRVAIGETSEALVIEELLVD